jgi:hypothetical protein
MIGPGDADEAAKEAAHARRHQHRSVVEGSRVSVCLDP